MATTSSTGNDGNAVDQFMAALDHPLKPELRLLREIILAVDPSIAEGIKWNAPSFRTVEYFATFNLRSRDCPQLILHFGAKVNEISKSGVQIADPERLLAWRGKDRAIVTFKDHAHLLSTRDAFSRVLRQWIAHVA